jgi:hypothetical protein
MNLVEDQLAERMLQASFEPGDTIVVDLAGDELTIERQAAQPEPVAAGQPA